MKLVTPSDESPLPRILGYDDRICLFLQGRAARGPARRRCWSAPCRSAPRRRAGAAQTLPASPGAPQELCHPHRDTATVSGQPPPASPTLVRRVVDEQQRPAEPGAQPRKKVDELARAVLVEAAVELAGSQGAVRVGPLARQADRRRRRSALRIPRPAAHTAARLLVGSRGPGPTAKLNTP